MNKALSVVQDGMRQCWSKQKPQQLLTILFGTSLILAATSAQAESPQGKASWRLEGTWVVSVDPPPPEEIAPTHIALASFIKDGIVIGSPDIYLPPPIVRIDNVQGVWKKTGGHEYASTFVAYAYGADPTLPPINTIKVNSHYQLTDKNSFVGESQLLICDLKLVCPDADPLAPKATLEGTRLQLQPL